MTTSSQSLPNHLPLHEGPFVPGCLDVMSGFGEKSVFMRLWYPTSLTDVKQHSPKWPRWMDETYLKGFSTVLGIWPIFLKIVRRWYSGDIHIPAVWGADLLSEPNSFPVVIFSHGLGACRFFYSILAMQLASHGIVVAAVEHKDESSAATFFYENEKKYSEGKKSFMLFRAVDETASGSHLVIRKRQLAIRASECSRALDFLKNVNEGTAVNNLLDPKNMHSQVFEQMRGRLDLQTASLMGHSFGGATTLVTASQDDRFKQLLVLDSWLFGLKNESEMPEVLKKFPKLFLNADYFQLDNNLSVMRRFVSPSDSKFTVKRTTHEHLCDTPQLVGMWLNRDKERIDFLHGIRINYHIVLSYLKQRIGDPIKWDNQTFLDENGHHVVPDISVRENSHSTGSAKL
ncbi:platelet-activating factor acetylhydrolase-like [Neocloeon triangulifer]|uniref:platelet-activating factor acetylhydrolase-like n=1 Tax=Neocloeon triangulifer TaxID=2078957 RepID=UPI00286EE4D3|nr:platelet-activating factor acetylhydrolase-like [Neocloeon triangulifer]